VIIRLPPEPEVGTTVEIVDGQNAGNRYRRADNSVWVELGTRGQELRGVNWSSIWWAVTEDGSGGTSVRVLAPDPHPTPWFSDGAAVRDQVGQLTCSATDPAAAARIVAAVNQAGAGR
jgi:hypothetical protein